MGAFEDFFTNDVANALDPNKNGVGNFFNNDVKSFVTNDVGGFFKNTVGPIANDLIHTFSVTFTAIPKLMNSLFKAGENVLSGNGIYYLIGIGAVVVVGGGIVYYKVTHK